MSEVKKTKTALDNELRAKTVDSVFNMLASSGEEVLRISGNVIAFPTVDSEGNDAWIEMTIKVPKGERLGKGLGFIGYDGYSLADAYAKKVAQDEADAAKRKAENEAKATKAAERRAKVEQKES